MPARLYTLAASAAFLSLLAVSSADAQQRARSMYGAEGATAAPATTQSASSALEGTWVGRVNDKNGGTRSTSIRISNVSGSSANIDRDNGDTGRGTVSGNSVSFGRRNPMTLTVSGHTAQLSGTYDNGVAVNGTLTKR